MGIISKSSAIIDVVAEHRNGICDLCGIPMEMVKEIFKGEEIDRIRCRKCGGTKGQLISKTVSLHPPEMPDCPKFSCLWRFPLKLFFFFLLSAYHRKRVVYAEKHRRKIIPTKYRTGEYSPTNIRQAIIQILILSIRR